MNKISEDYDGLPSSSLRDAWGATCDLVVISADDQTHLAVLEKAYNELYLPVFPVSEGYDSFEKWVEFMNDPASPIEYKISVAGDNLRNPDGSTVIKGICVGMYFKESDAGYLGYVVVDPAFRTEGLGNALFKKHNALMLEAAQKHGKPLSGLFLDCNDPTRKDHPDTTYDPQKRLDKYIKWGGQVVPCTYTLPLIVSPPPKVDYLNLVSFPHPVTGKYASTDTTLEVIAELWHDNGVADPHSDADYKLMVRELKPSAAFNAKSRKPSSRPAHRPKGHKHHPNKKAA